MLLDVARISIAESGGWLYTRYMDLEILNVSIMLRLWIGERGGLL